MFFTAKTRSRGALRDGGEHPHADAVPFEPPDAVCPYAGWRDPSPGWFIGSMGFLFEIPCIAKPCPLMKYPLFAEDGLECVEGIGVFEECTADDVVVGRQRNGELVLLRVEFGVLDVREPERLVGYGAFFHHGDRDSLAVDGFPRPGR